MKDEIFAKHVRLRVLRMLYQMGYGHYGGSFSIVECLSVLYNGGLNISPKLKQDPNRDYVVLSKGHAGPALYAALRVKGFIPEEMLYTLNEGGTSLPSHPDMNKTPGVDMTTGSLGQGVAVACGIALKNKADKRNNFTTAIVGDGELDEGQCWEAFQFAASQKLSHLIVFIDYNKRQLDGYVWDICDLRDIADKLRSFGFDTQFVDGRNTGDIRTALESAKASSYAGPKAIVLDTDKGQGVPFLEQIQDNHHIRPGEDLNTMLHDVIEKLQSELERTGDTI